MNKVTNKTKLEMPAEQTTNNPSYSVDALMEKLGVIANVKVWKTIDNMVYLQGIVGKVKSYRSVIYFELKGSSTTLTVNKCPSELSPLEGEYIIALGHTHCVTLTAQYADESFHTPSSFGSALNSIIQQLMYEKSFLLGNCSCIVLSSSILGLVPPISI